MTIDNLDKIIIRRLNMIKYNNSSNHKLILKPYRLNVWTSLTFLRQMLIQILIKNIQLDNIIEYWFGMIFSEELNITVYSRKC